MDKKIEELKHSDDYKERFIAEARELSERCNKLHRMIVKYEANTLDFTPTCTIELLKEQLGCMEHYLYILELRAEYENIDLWED